MASKPDRVYTRSRTEKLGVKPQSRVALMGLKDSAFVEELRSAGALIAGRVGAAPCDMLIVRLDSSADLSRLIEARKRRAESSFARTTSAISPCRAASWT
jgi:hypothetical protein